MHTEVVIHSMSAYVWCGSLDEILYVRDRISSSEPGREVKFLINSNMTLTVLNLRQKTDPKVQQDFKGRGHYDKVKGQIEFTP